MKDVKEIRWKLWHSLDMLYVKLFLFRALLVAAFDLLIVLIKTGSGSQRDKLNLFLILLAVTALPLVLFCIWRTVQIFRCSKSYFFCKVKLSNPKGGTIRDTIRFTVRLQNEVGRTFVADTHSIFSTHRQLFVPSLEDYINSKIEAAYNEKTGQVIIIG